MGWIPIVNPLTNQRAAELVLFPFLQSFLLLENLSTFEQAPRVDRPPPALRFATTSSLPATQGQRSQHAFP
jgi:hypothetical protein